MLHRPLLAARRLAIAILCCIAQPVSAETFTASDFLSPPAAETQAAQQVLDAVVWEPADFAVDLEDSRLLGADRLVTFPSPLPSGHAPQDRVAMYWYAAKNDAGEITEAPAAVIVHSLHPQMIIGQAIARELAKRGIHAFLLTMPGYGDRQPASGMNTWWVTLHHAPQAIADVRRARDAVGVLPHIANKEVAVQGTSMGGFVAAVAASVDQAFSPVILAFSGANGLDVIKHGQLDAAVVRETLHRHGVTDEQLEQMLVSVEPAAVAHRLDPQTTWLFSASADTVVPPDSAKAMVDAAGLPADHHIVLPGDHYSVMLHLQTVVEKTAEIIGNGRLTMEDQ